MSAAQCALVVGSYAGLALLVGVVVFWFYFWPEGRWSRTIGTLAWSGWTVTAVTTIGLLWRDVARSHHDWREVIATFSGTSLVVRLALLCIAFAWLREVAATYAAPRYRAMAPSKSVLGSGALLLMPLTYIAGSRTAGGSWVTAKAVLAALHVSALTLWLGGLVVVAVIVFSRADPRALRAVLPRFSLVATACVIALVVSGLLTSLAVIGRAGDPFGSAYFALALAELFALCLILMVDNLRRFYVRKNGLTVGDVRDPGARALRGALATELVVAAIVLAISAVLTVTPT